MRIDDLNRTPVAPGAEKTGPAAQQPAPEPAPEKDTARGSDSAEVSRLAKALALPDAGRVEQLRLEVQSGAYNVSAEAVAKALINAHLKD
jgi:flagellar biosynthesis anti-sigma factor FlgM